MNVIATKKTLSKAKTQAPKSESAFDKAIQSAIDEEMSTIGKTKFTCGLCGKLEDTSIKRDRTIFYKTTDPNNKIGYTTICRHCIDKVVYQIDDDDTFKTRHEPTESTIKRALQYLDKPWLQSVYESCRLDCENEFSNSTTKDVWSTYIRTIQAPRFMDLRWKDGEGVYEPLPNSMKYTDEPVEQHVPEPITESPIPKKKSLTLVSDEEAAVKISEANKKKVLHDLGYDPFESASPRNRVIMFNRLAGYLGDNTDDQMKIDACINIVQSMTQADAINSEINKHLNDVNSIAKNNKLIKDLVSTKKDANADALALAKENGISLKNGGVEKGGDTWSGQVKKLRESKLRFGEVDGFDIGTSEGMRQVAYMSMESVLEQVKLDDSDLADLTVKQTETITGLNNKCDAAIEEARLLKRENRDLKAFLREKGFVDAEGRLIE